jgi:hypothetical protein
LNDPVFIQITRRTEGESWSTRTKNKRMKYNRRATCSPLCHSPCCHPPPRPCPPCSSFKHCTCPSPLLLPAASPPFDPAVALAASLLSFSCSPSLCRCLCCCPSAAASAAAGHAVTPLRVGATPSSLQPAFQLLAPIYPAAAAAVTAPPLLPPAALCATPLAATPPRPCPPLLFS